MDEINKTLRKGGHRVTFPRRAVVSVVLQAERWLSPEEVFTRAQADWPSLGLVTVYRTLALLSDLGFIRRVHFKGGCHGYARTELVHGHHLVCRNCNQAVEVIGTDEIEPMIERIAERTGYTIEDHLLEFVGLCPSCQGCGDDGVG